MTTFNSILIENEIEEATKYFKYIGLKQERLVNDDFYNSGFLETHRHKNFISVKMASWIIYESNKYARENGGFTTKRHKNYPTTDLPVSSIKPLKTIVYNLVNMDILPQIATNYGLYKHMLEIKDLFVVKYEAGKQAHLDFHKDGSILSFNILLNPEYDFDGGGTIIKYKDGDKLFESERCDLFIHSGRIKHSGRKITRGVRYILVGFINYLGGDDVDEDDVLNRNLLKLI